MKIKKRFAADGNTFIVNADGLTPEELHELYQDAKKEIMSDKDASKDFLISLGAYDDNLNLTPMFADSAECYAPK